jgi:DNA-binding NarL/FixJ family response regulator
MDSKRTRVLHLEDDKVQTQLFEMLLRFEEDLEHVGAVHTSATLLEEIESRRPDVLVMDLRMDDSDPAALIGRVRERFSSLEIVLFTGDDDPQALGAARAAGAAHHVTKGREIALLLATIRKAAARLEPRAERAHGAGDHRP